MLIISRSALMNHRVQRILKAMHARLKDVHGVEGAEQSLGNCWISSIIS